MSLHRSVAGVVTGIGMASVLAFWAAPGITRRHISSSASNHTHAAADTGAWQLVWSDEFNEPRLDGTKWNIQPGLHPGGSGEMEYYTGSDDNIRVRNGNLELSAVKRDENGKPFTSGRINTLRRGEWRYGRFEARIRVPPGRGVWPTFWLLGNNMREVGWPKCGEIDIMEMIGKRPNRLYGTIHGPGYANPGIGSTYDLGQEFASGFHVFGVEWTSDYIRWYVDGTTYERVEASKIRGTWVFDRPFYIVLNLAIGGKFAGPPDDATAFPKTMLVDWVRVYQRPQ